MTDMPPLPNPMDEPHLRRFKIVLAAFQSESPRGMVLMSSSLLDEHLSECIASRLVDNPAVAKLTTGFNAPLGTFSARIVAALGLGLLSENEFHDLEIIRGIRNDFAHQLEVSFDDQTIKDRCRNLRHAVPDRPDDVPLNAEVQFSSAAAALILNLTNRAFWAAEARIEAEAWPY